MGSCTSAVSPKAGSVEPTTPLIFKTADTIQYDTNNNNRKVRSASVRRKRFPRSTWIVEEYTQDAQNEIRPVTRMGYVNTYFDARKEVQDQAVTKPKVGKGELWVDEKLSRELPRNRDGKLTSAEWKRPKEFCEDPKLFAGEVNRFNVNQGGFGTCWFNSVLAPLADQSQVLYQIVPKGSYQPHRAKYDGVFHAQFWRMGQWFDVYIDDCLPVTSSRPSGASCLEPNGLWVSLLEKSFIKFFGGFAYMKDGGPSQLAFITMTGGFTQTLYTRRSASDKETTKISKMEMFKQIKTALSANLTVTTSMDKEEKRTKSDPSLQGLVPNHCYSITGATVIKRKSGNVHLIRMRNPWGNHANSEDGNGEWTGPWSDDSQEWNSVDKKKRKRWKVQSKSDGEFWISLDDFEEHYHHVIFCNQAPEFGETFKCNIQLDHVLNIIGQFTMKTWRYNYNSSGGPIRQKFIIKIPKKGVNRKGRHRFRMQLIKEDRNEMNEKESDYGYQCPLKIFKIEECILKGENRMMCLQDITNDSILSESTSVLYDYQLKPGLYLLMPDFADDKVTKNVTLGFCVRIFSAIVNLKCREVIQLPTMFQMVDQEVFSDRTSLVAPCEYSTNTIGQFRVRTVATNERYKMKNEKFILTIPVRRRNKKSTVLVHLLQEQQNWPKSDKSLLPIRLELYRIDAKEIKDGDDWVVVQQLSEPPIYPVETEGTGSNTTYCGYTEVSYKYSLAAGQYILLPTTRLVMTEPRSFCVRTFSNVPHTCEKANWKNEHLFIREAQTTIDVNNSQLQLENHHILFGAWIRSKNAGGQIENVKSYASNPQYCITITGDKSYPVMFDLLQEIVEPIHFIGCQIYKISKDDVLPAEYPFFVRIPSTRHTDIDGKRLVLINSVQNSGYYMLETGRYLAVLCTDKMNQEKKHTLFVAAPRQLSLDLRPC